MIEEMRGSGVGGDPGLHDDTRAFARDVGEQFGEQSVGVNVAPPGQREAPAVLSRDPHELADGLRPTLRGDEVGIQDALRTVFLSGFQRGDQSSARRLVRCTRYFGRTGGKEFLFL